MLLVPARHQRQSEEECRTVRRTDTGLVIVPGSTVDGGSLHVDRPQPVPQPVRGVDAVDEVGAYLRNRLARRLDVVQRRGVQQLVVQRVDEAELAMGELVRHRDHPGQQRRGQAGATDAVLVPVRAVGEHLSLTHHEARVRVAGHRDVRYRAHGLAAEVLRDGVRHLALLVEGLGEQDARPATAAGGVVAGRCRRPRSVGEVGVRALPAVLPQPLAVRADADAGTADTRHVWQVGREVDGLVLRVGSAAGFVAGVATGEVDRDAGQRGLQRELLVELDVIRPQQVHVIGVVSPRVRDDVRDVVVDRFGPGGVQPGAAVRGTHVDDLRAGSHGVHGLDVERLLAVPAVPAALVDQVEVIRPRDDLRELARLELRLVVDLAVLLGIREDRRRGERVGDRHGHAATVDAGAEQVALAVRRLVLLRTVPADRVRLLLAIGRRLIGGDLLAVVVRTRLNAEPGAGRRAGLHVGRLVQLRALVDAEDTGDDADDPGRGTRGQRQRGRIGPYL